MYKWVGCSQSETYGSFLCLSVSHYLFTVLSYSSPNTVTFLFTPLYPVKRDREIRFRSPQSRESIKSFRTFFL